MYEINEVIKFCLYNKRPVTGKRPIPKILCIILR